MISNEKTLITIDKKYNNSFKLKRLRLAVRLATITMVVFDFFF